MLNVLNNMLSNMLNVLNVRRSDPPPMPPLPSQPPYYGVPLLSSIQLYGCELVKGLWVRKRDYYPASLVASACNPGTLLVVDNCDRNAPDLGLFVLDCDDRGAPCRIGSVLHHADIDAWVFVVDNGSGSEAAAWEFSPPEAVNVLVLDHHHGEDIGAAMRQFTRMYPLTAEPVPLRDYRP